MTKDEIKELEAYRELGTLEEFEAFVKAKKEERMFIFPKKIGDEIYIVEHTKDGNGLVIPVRFSGLHIGDVKYRRGHEKKEYMVLRSSITGFSRKINLDKIGESVFFTYQEVVDHINEYRESYSKKKNKE